MTTYATSPAYETLLVVKDVCELSAAPRRAYTWKEQRGPLLRFSLERHPAAAGAACVLSLPDASRYDAAAINIWGGHKNTMKFRRRPWR